MHSALPFDQHTRFAATREALCRLAPANGARILDVGGFPGTFSRFLQERGGPWHVLTADVAPVGMRDYRILTPGPLPFADGEFDFVVSNDTLEHVPPPAREEFLLELQRCASRAVVVAAPCHHESTAAVERSLNDLHGDLFGAPHPWLVEHREYGLPAGSLLLSARQPGWNVTAVVGNAPLREWLQWQYAHLARQLREDFSPAAEALERACHLFNGPNKGDALCYRLVVTLERGAATVPAAEERLLLHEQQALEEGAYCIAVAGLLETLLRCVKHSGGDDRAAILKVAIEERVVAALRHAEASQSSKPVWRRLMGGRG